MAILPEEGIYAWRTNITTKILQAGNQIVARKNKRNKNAQYSIDNLSEE